MHTSIMQKALHENHQYFSYDCLCNILKMNPRGIAGSGKISGEMQPVLSGSGETVALAAGGSAPPDIIMSHF